MLSARAVLAACRAVAVACFVAALLTPARFLAVVELSLLGLLPRRSSPPRRGACDTSPHPVPLFRLSAGSGPAPGPGALTQKGTSHERF